MNQKFSKAPPEYIRDARTIKDNINAAYIKCNTVYSEPYKPVIQEISNNCAKNCEEWIESNLECLTKLVDMEIIGANNGSWNRPSILGVQPDKLSSNHIDIYNSMLDLEKFIGPKDKEIIDKYREHKEKTRLLGVSCLDYLQFLARQWKDVGYMLIAAPELKPFVNKEILERPFIPKNKKVVTRDSLDLQSLSKFTELARRCSMEGVATNGY